MAYETFVKRGYTVSIDQDGDPESPRECDNLGKMFCLSKRYDLGDKHADMPFEIEPGKFSGFEALRKYMEVKGAVVVLPLYLYDHSGLRMKVGSFQGLLPQGHAEFDSYQCGVIFAMAEDVRREYSVKRITPAVKRQVEKVLRDEVETYDTYLRGDIWCYSIKDKEGIVIDSCCGCYSLEEARRDATMAVPGEEAPVPRPEPLQALLVVAAGPGQGAAGGGFPAGG